MKTSKKRRRKNKRPIGRCLRRLLSDLKIRDWDVLLVGDGSGSGWDVGVGWSCIVIDKYTKTRKLIYGGGNTGTVNIAELMAYVHAMLWYSGHTGKELKKQNPGKTIKVHIVTDSRVIVGQGVRTTSRSLDGVANRALWACMNDLARQGYSFHYHWIDRMSNELNWAADQMAGRARISLRNCLLIDDTPNTDGNDEEVSIYDLNPLIAP